MTQNIHIYLDNQASTRTDPRVLSEMLPYFTQEFGNPHSNDHWHGWQAKHAVDAARAAVGAFIQANPDEVVFTSGATEANNLAILGSLKYLRSVGKSKIIVSAFEHKCVLQAAKAAADQGFEVITLYPSKTGCIETATLEAALDKTVGLVSIMTVNNEIGTIQPIKEIAALCHQYGALLHTDAAQATCFMPLDVNAIGADMMSLSAHKMYGPKGIGALYIRQDLQSNIQPILHGGGQENGLRSGTLPTALCVGFGKACEIVAEEREAASSHMKMLSDKFLELSKEQDVPFAINGDTKFRHPGNLNLQFNGYDAHSIIQVMQPYVSVSTGSACTTGTPEPSHALRALGISEEEAISSIRISFAPYNTENEVKTAVNILAKALEILSQDQLRLETYM